MKVLHKFLAITLMAGASLTSAAQSYMFDNPENTVYFGVRAGLDITSAANGGGMYSNKAGFSLGAVYNIPVWTNLYFEPGLYLFYNTFGTVHLEQYKTTVTITDAQGSQYEEEQTKLYQVDGTLRNFGFRIPLNVGFHFDLSDDLKLHVFTGPQINLSLTARYHQNSVIKPTGDKVDACSENAFGTGGFKHVDLQWDFGVGFTWQKYYMSVGGAVGVTRMKDESVIKAGPYEVNLDRNLRRNLFNISIGYNF